MIFKRNRAPQPITPVQKILTYGLILFMVYVFISERREKLEPALGESAKTVKVTNHITGDSEYFYPNQKIQLSIKAGDIDRLKDKPVLSEKDDLILFEIQPNAVKSAGQLEIPPTMPADNTDITPMSPEPGKE